MIDLSEHTVNSMRPWLLHVGSSFPEPRDNQLTISEILCWIRHLDQSEATPEQSPFKREVLYTAFLSDLYIHLSDDAEHPSFSTKKQTSWKNKAGFMCLMLAGIIYELCNGFDGVTSILSLVGGVPVWAVFIIGFAFSFLSIAIFFGFELYEISRQLGVEFSLSQNMLDVLVEETQLIKLLRKQIKKELNENSHLNLAFAHDLLNMLQERHNALHPMRQFYTEERNRPYLKILKFFFGALTGILFFSYGFFSGQSLVLAVMGLFNASIALYAWPIILASNLVGLAALCVYWFAERNAIEELVGRWWGLDSDKIDLFANKDLVAKQTKKLAELDHTLNHLSNTHARNERTFFSTSLNASNSLLNGSTMHPVQS